MKAYADTSFLVSLYLPDVHSDKANAWMRNCAASVPFTPLHRHELRNAIRLAVWRKQVDGAARSEIFRAVETDLKDGFLKHQPVAWTDAFREADRIGATQTEQIGVTAADLFHIGIASLLDAAEFLTFDAIQRKAAAGAGLKCRVL